MQISLHEVLVIYGLIVAWLALAIPTGISWFNIRSHIAQNHPALWQQMKPPVGRWPFEQRLAYRRFVWFGYRKVGDPTLTRLVKRAQLMTALCFLFLVSLYILAMVRLK